MMHKPKLRTKPLPPSPPPAEPLRRNHATAWHNQATMDRERPFPDPFQPFYHVACMGNWKQVLEEQVECFRKAGLSPMTYVLGNPADAAYVERFVPVVGHNPTLKWYETPTLDCLHKWSIANPTGAVLYCHTKGVSRPWDEGKGIWRRLMANEVIVPWRANLAALTRCDTIGVNFSRRLGQHYYEGNFWMARADWVAHLAPPWEHRAGKRRGWMGSHRHSAECWLFNKPFHRAETLVCSGGGLWHRPTCERLLAESLARSAAPLSDKEIRGRVRLGRVGHLPPALREKIDVIAKACACHFRRDIDPLLEELRPYFPQDGGESCAGADVPPPFSPTEHTLVGTGSGGGISPSTVLSSIAGRI